MGKLLIILYILLVVMVAGLISSTFFTGNTYSWHKTTTTTADQEKVVVPSVTFLAAGDIMLSRNVAGTIKKANDSLLPFRGLENLLKSTDFNFANLESPINGTDVAEPSPSVTFNSPSYTLPGLTEYNFKVLNLANNHAFDQYKPGLDSTERYLAKQAITTLGSGETLDQAWQGKIVSTNNIDVGFIGASYASENDGGTRKNNYIARIEDVDRLKASILDLKSRADFVVVTMHAGTEYEREPNQQQIDFARAAIDAGADMVIGAHPHWIQTVERYAPNCPSPGDGEGALYRSGATGTGRERSKCGPPKYIFYSLGNFIFDQMFSQDTREGLTLKITIDKPADCHPEQSEGSNDIDSSLSLRMTEGCQAQLKQIELIPIIIDNYCCPRIATPDESKDILNKIKLEQIILY